MPRSCAHCSTLALNSSNVICRFSYPVDYYQSTASAPHPATTQTSCRTRHTGVGSCCAGPPAGCRSVGRVCRVVDRSFAQPPHPVLLGAPCHSECEHNGVEIVRMLAANKKVDAVEYGHVHDRR